MKKIFLVALIAASITSCKKDKASQQVCYQCEDAFHNPLNKVCGNSEDDAYSKVFGIQPYPGGSGVIDTKEKFLQSCPKIP